MYKKGENQITKVKRKDDIRLSALYVRTYWWEKGLGKECVIMFFKK